MSGAMALREAPPAGAVTTADRVFPAVLTTVGSAVIVGYLSARAGLPVSPYAVLFLAILAGVSACIGLRMPNAAAGEVAIALVIVVGVAGWLLRMAWPSLLPLGGASDLTHHLQMVDYIERHWRLPRAADMDLMGNMVNYTPGLHLVTAMAGAWARTDGLHAIHTVVALSVALKSAFVLLIALRVLPPGVPRLPFAAGAVLLMFLPYDYTVGSFATYSFFAQVFAELFAVAMWWAATLWDERPSRSAATLFGIAGAATFLSWPIWIGAPCVLFAAVAALRRDLPLGVRFKDAALAFGPIAVVAIVFAAERVHAAEIVATGGSVFRPTIARFGWTFIIFTAVGVATSLADRRSRSTIVFLAAIVLQALALYGVATVQHADSPYMALKMVHIVVFPLSVCGAYAAAFINRALASRAWAFARAFSGAGAQTVAWLLLMGCLRIEANSLSAIRRPKPVITEDLFQAGTWARAHVPAGCVEYLVRDDNTAYWLHLAVLGNPSQPTATSPTPVYDFPNAASRWMTNTGFPFAIVDLSSVTRDVRTGTQELARFNTVAVDRRDVEGPCPGR